MVNTCLNRELEQINPSFTVDNPGTVWEIIWTDTVGMAKICDESAEETKNVPRERSATAFPASEKNTLAQSVLQYNHSCTPWNPSSQI